MGTRSLPMMVKTRQRKEQKNSWHAKAKLTHVGRDYAKTEIIRQLKAES